MSEETAQNNKPATEASAAKPAAANDDNLGAQISSQQVEEARNQLLNRQRAEMEDVANISAPKPNDAQAEQAEMMRQAQIAQLKQENQYLAAVRDKMVQKLQNEPAPNPTTAVSGALLLGSGIAAGAQFIGDTGAKADTLLKEQAKSILEIGQKGGKSDKIKAFISDSLASEKLAGIDPNLVDNIYRNVHAGVKDDGILSNSIKVFWEKADPAWRSVSDDIAKVVNKGLEGEKLDKAIGEIAKKVNKAEGKITIDHAKDTLTAYIKGDASKNISGFNESRDAILGDGGVRDQIADELGKNIKEKGNIVEKAFHGIHENAKKISGDKPLIVYAAATAGVALAVYGIHKLANAGKEEEREQTKDDMSKVAAEMKRRQEAIGQLAGAMR
jgi:hypothetical protein